MIFVVGNCAGFIEQGAVSAGFDASKIFKFSTSDEAKLIVQEKLQENDVIFIKGSHSIKMENIVEEIKAK